MKDGDVSLILKSVTTAINRTYQCDVFMTRTNPWKNEPIRIFSRRAVPPGVSVEFSAPVIR